MGSIPTRFDVIVVGAGPAGAAAAYHAAKRGFKVLLVERGRGAGSKELYGGRIYVGPLRDVWPGIEKEAPIHRWVVEERLSIIGDGEVATLSYRYSNPVSFTAYLPDLTRWMVSKAEEEGVVFVDEVRVDSLVRDGEGRVIGIRSGPDVAYASVVVDAEGANRLLLERAGIVDALDAKRAPIALGVKEVLKLPKGAIEDRLGLSDGEGLSWLIAGTVTKGIPGGGFIYTFKDTIAVGVVVHLGHSVNAVEAGVLKESVKDLVESIRLHPYFKRLWRDSDIVEYGAHLTVECGLDYMPPHLAYDGLVIVGDAAGLLLNLGYTVRGVDLASYSGMLAAEAIAKAHDLGGMNAENLRVYENMVKESFIYKELVRHRGICWLTKERRFFTSYANILLGILSNLYVQEFKHPTVFEAVKASIRSGGEALLPLIGRILKVVREL
ncbi:MAG: FAD-dependent oxidoreductase [Desulfurococcales archaeon]|nr:FAD-dependent oxidoreductase [Desulfurococcales archaeon]